MLGRRLRPGFADSLVRSPELSRLGLFGRRHRHSSVPAGIPSRFFAHSVGAGVGATIVIGTYSHVLSHTEARHGQPAGWRRF